MRTALVSAGLVSVCSSILCAQQDAPIGILKGELVHWTGSSSRGSLTFRTADDRLYNCAYDEKTYLEHANERITMSGTITGDRIEILSDHKPGAQACYARTIQVLDAVAVTSLPGMRPRLRSVPGVTENFAPRGDITFAAVVMGMEPEHIILRTRTQRSQTLLLREDTRFLSSGLPSDRDSLPVSTHVFIRAGHNLEGDVEVYQVVWGDILEP